MNFLPAELAGSDGALALRLADGTLLPLPEEAAQRWHNLRGQRVILGIRPEHMAGGAAGPATLTLVPHAIEPLGAPHPADRPAQRRPAHR